MSEESVLIDLDTPSTRSRQWSVGFGRRWRSLRSRKISILGALGLMVAGGGIGGATATYVAHRTNHLRVATVSAEISLDPTPRVRFTDGQVTLDGSVTITNVGTSPIRVVGLHMDSALASLNGAASNGAIYPGVASVISATVRMTCSKDSPRTVDSQASMVVSVSVDGESSEAPVTFDYGDWEMRMLVACPPA